MPINMVGFRPILSLTRAHTTPVRNSPKVNKATRGTGVEGNFMFMDIEGLNHKVGVGEDTRPRIASVARISPR